MSENEQEDRRRNYHISAEGEIDGCRYALYLDAPDLTELLKLLMKFEGLLRRQPSPPYYHARGEQ